MLVSSVKRTGRSTIVQGITVERRTTEMHAFLQGRQQTVPCRYARFVGRESSIRNELCDGCAAPGDNDGFTLGGMAEDRGKLPSGIGCGNCAGHPAHLL